MNAEIELRYLKLTASVMDIYQQRASQPKAHVQGNVAAQLPTAILWEQPVSSACKAHTATPMGGTEKCAMLSSGALTIQCTYRTVMLRNAVRHDISAIMKTINATS